jgi:hypothetical protein
MTTSASDDNLESSDDHAYFRAIETTFVRLRGAPMLLSPADWQVARRWRGAGIPLELVESRVEEMFARRRARGAKGRVQSLSYCEDAVLVAWQEHQELTAAGRKRSVAALDPAPRLAALARSLPGDLPEREVFASRILSLSGDTEEVERGLALVDAEILRSTELRLSAEACQVLNREAQQALESLARRLPESQVEQARMRLFRQLLRRRKNLPLLSLFSPDAQTDG